MKQILLPVIALEVSEKTAKHATASSVSYHPEPPLPCHPDLHPPCHPERSEGSFCK